MHRRRFLKTIGIGAAALAAPSCLRAADGKGQPNIIFIFSDDYGIGGVGCYGAKYKTPNIDALAASGMRFEYCYSAPLCAPSRAMAMFGRYGFRTGVVDNGTGGRATPDKEVCIAKVLKEAGYATAVAGKWRQLSYFETKQDAQAWGFDEFMIWGVGGKGERYWDPVYNHNGQTLANVAGKYGPDLLHEFVVDFIRRHKDGPFFVYYPTPLIHGPIMRTPDSAPNSPDLFADNITYLDKLVGKLVAELDQMNLREQTVIVFTGDNGNVGGGTINGRAIDGGKGSMKEGGSRVPLIVDWKGTTPAGIVSKDLVDFSDFFPTIVELAGAKLPEGVTIDGHSFAPQLRGEKGTPREWVYVQLGDKCYVCDGRWKLNNDGQFFDMKDAPFAETLVPVEGGDAEAQAARKKLQPILDGLVAQHKADQAAPKQPKQKAQKQQARKVRPGRVK